MEEHNTDNLNEDAGYGENAPVDENPEAHNGTELYWKDGTFRYYSKEVDEIPVMSDKEVIARKRRTKRIEAKYLKVEDELETLRTDLRIKDWTEKERAEAEKREKELVRELQKIQTPKFINAVNEIVEGNLRFVVSMAKRFVRIIPLEEAIQYGNLGLRKAAIRWDPSGGNKFTTYAAWWIFGSITGGIAECRWPFRMSARSGYLIIKIYDAMGRLEQKGITEPTAEMIAEEINNFAKSKQKQNLRRRMHRKNNGKAPAEISVAVVRQAQRADVTRNSVPLDYEYEDGRKLAEVISSKVAKGKSSGEDEMIERMMRGTHEEVSRKAMTVLREVDKTVVELRIMEDKPPSIYEVGDMFGKSKQWAPNRVKLALPAMRDHLEGQGYTADDLM